MRLLLKITGWLLLIPAVPFLVWFVANRIDEPRSQESLRLEIPPVRPVADADNAWLYLLGIGAAEDADPIDYGRQRISAHEAWLERARDGEDAPSPSMPDPVSQVGPDPERDGTGELCPIRDIDCIAWAGEHQPMLERLERANRLLLDRYEQMLGLPDWKLVGTPSLELPFPNASIATLRLNLLALALHHAAQPAETATALEGLADEVDFWHRVRANPQDLFSTALAGRRIEDAQRIASAVIDRHLPGDARVAAALDRILAPQFSPTDWSEAVRHEYRMFATGMETAVPGPLGALGQCFRGSATDGCLRTFLMSSSYAHQATLNLRARHMLMMQQVLEAPPAETDRVAQELAPEYEATFVKLDDTGTILRQMAYNYTGRILAQVAVPAFDHHLRLHDQEALRRMFVLKRRAMEQGLPATRMSDFLASSTLRSPYDGGPFGWDEQARLIYFDPGADNYWQLARLEVAIPDIGN